MPIYLGNKEIGVEYVDSYQLGNIYLGLESIQGQSSVIPNSVLISWWDASPGLVTMTGSNTVTSWLDRSGNGNTATAFNLASPPVTNLYYSSSKPSLNNKPTIQFSAGYLYYPNTLFTTSGSTTTFIVGTSAENSNLNTPAFIGEGFVTSSTAVTSSTYGVTLRPHQPGFGIAGIQPLNPTIGNTGNNTANLGNMQRIPNNVSSSMSVNTFYTWGWRVNNFNQFSSSGSLLSSSLSVNNNIQNFPPNPNKGQTFNNSFGGITATTLLGRRIGADLYDSLNDQQYYYGEIAEIIVYNRYLSDAEYNQVLLYLNNKYQHY